MAQTLDVTGGQLIYDEFGEGPETIVFVHGAGGNHLSWWQQIPVFRDRYRCVTYEVRGWGAAATTRARVARRSREIWAN